TACAAVPARRLCSHGRLRRQPAARARGPGRGHVQPRRAARDAARRGRRDPRSRRRGRARAADGPAHAAGAVPGPRLGVPPRRARVMGGVWVFPGGALAAADGDGDVGLRAAAIRELVEETTVALPADAELVAFSRWITPEALPIRFDTVFYVAHAPDDAAPAI